MKHLSPADIQRLKLRAIFISGTVALLFFALSSGMSFIGYTRESRDEVTRFKWYMLGLASMASQLVDGDIHQSFTKPEQSYSQPYKKTHAALQQALLSTPYIKYIYTYILRDGKLYYIFDTENPNKADTKAPAALMQLEDEEPGMMRQAIENQTALAELTPVPSAWGDLISAYAPIYNSKHQFVAMLGIDVRADDYIQLISIKKRSLQRNLLLAAIFSSFLGVTGYLFWRRRLVNAIERHKQQRYLLQIRAAELSLRESEERIQLQALAMDNTANGLLLVDAQQEDYPAIYANKAFCQITGYPLNEVLGSNCRFLQGDDTNQSSLETIRDALNKGVSCRVMLRNYRKDGMLFWNDLSISPLFDAHNTLTHFVGVINNVTELKNAQEMLRLTNVELRQKNSALEEAHKASEHARLVKRDFLANMSHEIRTPMNGIIGTVDLLTATPLTNAQKKYTSILKQTGESLLAIVNDILDFSKLESGKLTLHKSWFNPAEIIHEAAALLGASTSNKALTIHVACDENIPLRVLGDAERVRQIITNYLSNAIKFTARGAITLTLAVKTKNANEATLIFSVKDEGIGIPKEFQQQIFTQFTQADTSISRKYGGTGLGLAICKQLATLMDGKVGVESTEGLGSTFWFEASFPHHLNAPLQADQLLNAPQHIPISHLKLPETNILLVEDNATNQMVVEAILKSFSAKVTSAKNGLSALKLFKRKRFDLVLMDVQMPIMNGFEATEKMRAYEQEKGLKHTPIIALTANALEGYREECLAAGMDDYYIKPIRTDTLAIVLERHLSPKKTAIIPSPETSPASKAVLSFNQAHLDHLLPILADRLPELIDRFIEESSAKLEQAKREYKEKHFQTVSEIAHMLKSSALNVGANLLAEILRTLERDAKLPKPDIQAQLQQADQEFSKVSALLKQYIKTIHS